MIEHLIDYLERHSRDVCAHTGGFDRMNRVTNTRGENLSRPGVVCVNLNDVTQQHEAVFTNIIEPAEKRTDKRGTRLRRQDSLGRRKAKCHINLDAFAR